MKTALLALCLLGTTTAFGQHGRPSPSHPQHAAEHALAAEHYIFSDTKYYSVRGDERISDLPLAVTRADTQSLGEAARILRKEHANLKKARSVFEN